MPMSPFKDLKKGVDMEIESDKERGGGRKSALKNSGRDDPSKSARVDPYLVGQLSYYYATTPVTGVGSDSGTQSSVSGLQVDSQNNSSGGAGKFSGGMAEKKKEEEASLRDLMLQMSKINTQLNDFFSEIDRRLDDTREYSFKFRCVLQVLKGDMATKCFLQFSNRECKI